jgi:hypothetical protein
MYMYNCFKASIGLANGRNGEIFRTMTYENSDFVGTVEWNERIGTYSGNSELDNY